MKSYDVAVIGGGILGCFAARNLCRRKLHIALLEAREDVCTGISRANTAIIYPGYDHKPGTLKAELCVRANARFDALCRELDVSFSRCGSLMVSFGEKADAVLRKKYENGLLLGVPGLRLLSGEDAQRMEPSLAESISSALYAPTAGTVNPWELGIAACENAAANGAALFLSTRVLGIRRTEQGYQIETDRGGLFLPRGRQLRRFAGRQSAGTPVSLPGTHRPERGGLSDSGQGGGEQAKSHHPV